MRAFFCLMVGCLLAPFIQAGAAEKVCGVYTNIIHFNSQQAMDAAREAQPAFLMEKHKKMLATSPLEANLAAVRRGGFNTLFMTIYPLWGKDWWEIPAARGLVKDALIQTRSLRVHLGLSIFNANFCVDPSRYPGARPTLQCDGTRPTWVCFFDDELWKLFIRNTVEMAKVSREAGGIEGIFIDPEGYGGECYQCFCDNCVRKFNAWSGEQMPTGLVKPDGWLHGRGLWTKYTQDFHAHEVQRHASAMRDAIHAIDPKLQLSSLLWDYPVAVGIGDARQSYFRNLAVGLGKPGKPAWTLPEHTYYSDAPDLTRIVRQIEDDIAEMGANGLVKVLPGVRVLRRDAASLLPRGKAIRDMDVPGYWMYELSDLTGKTPIDFEGSLVDSPDAYFDAFAKMNAIIRGSH